MNANIIITLIFIVILLWETCLFTLKKRNIRLFLPLAIFLTISMFNFFLLLLDQNRFELLLIVHLGYMTSLFMILLNAMKILHNDKNKLVKSMIKNIKKLSLIVFDVVLIFVAVLLIYNSFFVHNEPYSDTLLVYDWGDYFAPGVLDRFEEEYGVEIKYYVYDDEFEMYNELKSSSIKYDFVFVSDALIGKMAEEGLLTPIRFNKLNNIENVNEEFLLEDSSYGVPYTWGTTGIAVNTKYVDEYVDSWSVFWNPKYGDKISILNNPDEVISYISYFLSGNILPQTRSEVAKIKQFFDISLNNVIVLNDIDVVDAMIEERIWIAHTYNGGAATMIEEVPEIEYVLPKEGFPGWIDYMAIPSVSENKATAELFIDYLLRPEVAAEIVNYQYYASANKAAEDFIYEEILNDPTVYIADEELDKLNFFGDVKLSKNYDELRNYVFNRLTNED